MTEYYVEEIVGLRAPAGSELPPGGNFLLSSQRLRALVSIYSNCTGSELPSEFKRDLLGGGGYSLGMAGWVGQKYIVLWGKVLVF